MREETKSGLWVPAEPKFVGYWGFFNAFENFGIFRPAAAGGGGGGGGGPPAGYTGLLDAETMAAGAYATTANTGSAGSNWVANHTGLTVETTAGPGSRKWVKNPGSAWQDYLYLDAKTLGDLVSAGAGMLGFIFKCSANKAWCGMADNVLRSYVSAPNASMWIDINAASNAYTADAWAAGVFRWDGTKSYLKFSDNPSWAEGSDGTISSVANALRFTGDGWANQPCGTSYFISYNTHNATTADELLTYLASLLS